MRRCIGLAGQFAAVDENLTGRENVEMVGRLYHLGAKRPGPGPTSCSSGFASPMPPTGRPKPTPAACGAGSTSAPAWSAQPKVLLLDEPTTGLDPRSRPEFWDFIRDLVSDGAPCC